MHPVVLPMCAYIEQRKLTFLQKLCTIPPELLSRQMFDLRMNLFVLKGYKNQTEFIPDIWKIVQKYSLEEYLHTYLKSSVFPPKYVWKNIISRKIKFFYETVWHQRL